MTASVLIVDDDESWVSAAVETFSNAGYLVRGASTFPVARKLLESFGPDLLITDVRLREYNGLDLLVRWRGQHPRPAYLIVSGFEDPVLIKEAKRHGAYDFLIKPVDSATLLAKAAEALATRDKRRTPRKQVLPADLPATMAGRPVRVVDVSYDGLRLEMPLSEERPAGVPLEIAIPAFSRTITATPVWATTRAAESIQMCGAAVRLDSESALMWRDFVDALGPAAWPEGM